MRWIVFPALLAAVAANAEPRRLTVEEAVKAALEYSPVLRAARARARAADDVTLSSRGRFLPGVHVSDEQQHYNDEYAIPLGPTKFVARDVNTNTFVLAAQEPLVGIGAFREDYQANEANASAAREGVKALEAQVKEDVQTQLYRLFEARALHDIAGASQKQLEDQLQVARSRLAAGVLTNADVLRIEVAAANANQQVLQSDLQSQVARQGILSAIGLALDDATDFVEPPSGDVPQPPALEYALKLSESQRHEIAATRFQSEAASHNSQARFWRLLPELALEAAYIHIEGQALAPKDQAYLGLKLDWNAFVWGADWYAQRAVAEQAVAAEADAENTRRNLALDVSSRLSQAKSAASAVVVAEAAIKSAEEAYRVTDALLKAGSATTTDLLDAQAALTQARLNLVRARYQQAIVHVALQHALGI